MADTFNLDSSLLRSGSYDPATQELRLTFKNGQSWSYAAVPPDQAEALQGAGSSGKYFLENIRGQFHERRV